MNIFNILQVFALFFGVISMSALMLNSMPMEKRQAEQVLDLVPIGEFTQTQHGVRGMVWAYNNSLLLVEDFAYDGQGR